jgi:hypothetical protein
MIAPARRTVRLLPALACLALLPAAAVSGCGSSGDDSGTSATGGAAASTPTTATGTTASGTPGRATASPAEVLKDAKAALAQVTSYHVAGTEVDKDDGPGTIAADVSQNGSFRASLSSKSTKVEFIVTSGSGAASYIKGDEAFWLDSLGQKGAAAAKALADKWVKTPSSAGDALDSGLKQLLPTELAYCLDKNLGPLKNGGVKTVDGKQVVVIRDAGSRPGTAPGELYVTASGDALPLRLVQLGSRANGGTLDKRCYDADDASTTKSDYTLSDFNAVDPITAPRGAQDLETVIRAAGADTTA